MLSTGLHFASEFTAREHGGAFSFVCRVESRDEAALTEWRAMRVRSELRSVERELYW